MKLARRGPHVVLPIEGGRLAGVYLAINHHVALVFQDAKGDEAEAMVQDQIVLIRGSEERVLGGSRPGASFDPASLSPLIVLLGRRVREAIAQHNGELHVGFEGGLGLRIASTTGYEAWHFAMPRPGRPVGGSGPHIGITGAAGYLI